MIFNKQDILLGDARIDLEHQQILSTLERLQEPIVSKTLRIATCEKLLHYINQHIKDEENMMTLYYVPDMKEHITAHQGLQESFIKSLGLFIKTGGSAGSYIQEVFVNHITTYDVSMVEHIRRQKEIDATSMELGF